MDRDNSELNCLFREVDVNVPRGTIGGAAPRRVPLRGPAGSQARRPAVVVPVPNVHKKYFRELVTRKRQFEFLQLIKINMLTLGLESFFSLGKGQQNIWNRHDDGGPASLRAGRPA